MRLFPLCLMLPVTLALAQPGPAPAKQDPALLAEPTRTRWLPLAAAVEENQPDTLLALAAPNLIRIEGDRRVIRTRDDPTALLRRAFANWAERDFKVSSGHCFEEHIVQGDLASERGVFELVQADAEGNVERSSGHYHIVMRKPAGQWRIVVDDDTDEGGAVDAAAYRRAAAPDDFRCF